MFLCMVDSRARMQVWPCWRFTSMNPQAASQCEGRMPQVSQITGSPCKRAPGSQPQPHTTPQGLTDVQMGPHLMRRARALGRLSRRPW